MTGVVWIVWAGDKPWGWADTERNALAGFNDCKCNPQNWPVSLQRVERSAKTEGTGTARER